ncbi:MAG: hypothetical protein CM15mP59_4720 [Flavobacteriaceae bacterium]|nr:MAG: hypothetical protein CM15mP59_4720 [Flavobacteriaceae bacterium]
MKISLFIAKRIIGAKSYKNSVSSPIIKIGIIAITIGLVAMHIPSALVLVFKTKSKIKSAHLKGIFVCQPMKAMQPTPLLKVLIPN